MNAAVLRSWLRLFTVQAAWNYERMLGVGAARASEPRLRRLPGGPRGERFRAALARAAGYFNAHPYLVGLAVGALARAEHDGVTEDQVRRLRGALIGPLGSLGDRLIWAGALPALVAVGLVVAGMASPVVGAVTFFVAYNLVHLTLRTWGLAAGWRQGTGVARALTAAGLRAGLRVAGPVAGIAVGVALPVATDWIVADLGMGPRLGVGVVAALGIVLLRWVAPILGGLRFGLAAAFAALLLGWVWP